MNETLKERASKQGYITSIFLFHGCQDAGVLFLFPRRKRSVIIVSVIIEPRMLRSVVYGKGKPEFAVVA